MQRKRNSSPNALAPPARGTHSALPLGGAQAKHDGHRIAVAHLSTGTHACIDSMHRWRYKPFRCCFACFRFSAHKRQSQPGLFIGSFAGVTSPFQTVSTRSDKASPTGRVCDSCCSRCSARAVKCGNLLKKSAGKTAAGLGYGRLPAGSEMNPPTHKLPICLDLRTDVAPRSNLVVTIDAVVWSASCIWSNIDGNAGLER